MENISKKSVQSFEYLNSIDQRAWTLLHAPFSKFGHDTSNVVESFNQWIGTEREKSYLDILIGISSKIMTMFHERMNKYDAAEKVYCQKVNSKLNLIAEKQEVSVYCPLLILFFW